MSFSGLFSIGLSGLSAFSTGLEAVSSNIANSQTTGYKRVRTDFSDLVGAVTQNGDVEIAGLSRGSGVSATARQLISEQGAITRTNTATDLAISGDGFFVVSKEAAPTSASAYVFSRAGDFRPDALGNLVNSAGYFLQGARGGANTRAASLQGMQTVNLNVTPAGADPLALGALSSVEIDADGNVNATYANGETHTLYRIPLALFVNADGLEQAESTAFRNTSLSGEPRLSAAQTGSAGAIENSALEISSVDIGQEFSTLISTQRAYSTASKVISVADDLLKTIVQTAA